MDCDLMEAPAKWYVEPTGYALNDKYVARATIDGRAEGYGNTEAEALASARQNDA